MSLLWQTSLFGLPPPALGMMTAAHQKMYCHRHRKWNGRILMFTQEPHLASFLYAARFY